MIAGSFVERNPSAFAIDLILNTHDFQLEWSRCSLLANYIAKYMAYQFTRPDRAEKLISTVTNDLLEAVIKVARDQTDISVHCFQDGDDLLLGIEHTIRAEALGPFQEFVGKLCSQNSHDINFNTLTDSKPPAVSFNQKGLARMVHDYMARVAARVDPDSGMACMQVCLPTKELVA